MAEGLLSSPSSWPRSRPRDFLTGALDFLGAFAGVLASSSAARAAFSAFFLSASAALASWASLITMSASHAQCALERIENSLLGVALGAL